MLMNSRMEEDRGFSSEEAAKSGIIERYTRRTTPQQRPSRMRIACARNISRGSRMVEDVRQNLRIDGYAEAGLASLT